MHVFSSLQCAEHTQAPCIAIRDEDLKVFDMLGKLGALWKELRVLTGGTVQGASSMVVRNALRPNAWQMCGLSYKLQCSTVLTAYSS